MGVNIKWYRKNPSTMSRKLRKAIMDVLPFDVNQREADVILRTIFDTIVKGVKRDGFVTIMGLGRFSKRFYRAQYQTMLRRVNGKAVHMGKQWVPDRYALKFKPSKVIGRSLNA